VTDSISSGRHFEIEIQLWELCACLLQVEGSKVVASVVAGTSRMSRKSSRSCPLILIYAVFLLTFESVTRIWWCSHADQRVFVERGDNPHLR
jgi:hypothetical protein